jgi:hypothetical protein
VSPLDAPFLFVFDNFETLTHPMDLFEFLDSQIRLPNKVLITTRKRGFKADYPIEVSGMTEDEASQLMTTEAERLGILKVLTQAYRDKVYQEADGHPYIIKMLLGEVAKAGQLVPVERIMAGREDMLDALFERTYMGLSPAAKRVFLTLCRWRSAVPELALEAVLLRPTNDEKIGVEGAVEELIRSSFVEAADADDGTRFLAVPLVAHVFGRRKLEVSPMKTAIEADFELLQVIGAAKDSSARLGIEPRVRRLFVHAASEATRDEDKFNELMPVLEFVCKGYAPAWLLLADLYEELGSEEGREKAKQAVLSLLERADDVLLQRRGWQKLRWLCEQTGDSVGGIHALVEFCRLPGTPFMDISAAANRVSRLFSESPQLLDSEEKRIVVRDLATLMESRTIEADATDLSRLAWLYLRLGDEGRARTHTMNGLAKDPNNEYCRGLAETLGLQ